MKTFLRTGCLGGLKVGMPISDAFLLLGKPEDTGFGLGRWRIESYSARSLQISHHSAVVGLIGIYFKPATGEVPILPAALNCNVPFSGLTTRDDVIAYLDADSISWTWDLRLRDAINIKAGLNVVANFEEGLLCSLLSSSPEIG